MIPMNSSVIIETSKCIPDYTNAVPFSPLSSSCDVIRQITSYSLQRLKGRVWFKCKQMVCILFQVICCHGLHFYVYLSNY